MRSQAMLLKRGFVSLVNLDGTSKLFEIAGYYLCLQCSKAWSRPAINFILHHLRHLVDDQNPSCRYAGISAQLAHNVDLAYVSDA